MVARKNSLTINEAINIKYNMESIVGNMEDFIDGLGDHMIEFHRLKILEGTIERMVQTHDKDIALLKKEIEQLKKPKLPSPPKR